MILRPFLCELISVVSATRTIGSCYKSAKQVIMSFKPLPPVRGMSGGGFRVSEDSASIADTVSTTKSEAEDVGRRIWADTQWTNLSVQARDLGLPKLPYFDQGTMLLSKEVNAKLWKTLVSTPQPSLRRHCSNVTESAEALSRLGTREGAICLTQDVRGWGGQVVLLSRREQGPGRQAESPPVCGPERTMC